MKTAEDYQLQACRNLEQVFAARGDREAVRHFQQRIRSLQTATKLKQTGGDK